MAEPEESRGSDARGVYGLRIAAPPEFAHLLAPADPSWPELEIAVRTGPVGGVRDHVDEERATLVLLGAVAVVDRSPGRAVFTFAEGPDPEAVVHPYLAPVAGLVAHWHGRESLHAGAFVASGGAWGVLTERGGGKSTMLARLALDGIPILTDDVLVIEGGTAFAGPRAIDLRRKPARALGVGEALGVLGKRERWRVRLDGVEGAVPLRGWVFLTWGDELAVRPVPPGSRLQRLAQQRTILLTPRDPTNLLRLAALPAFELERPRLWSSLEGATKALLRSLP
jgi:hypothetical protein